MQVVDVTLTHTDAYITSGSDDSLEQLEHFWSYYLPGYRFTPAYLYRGWDGRVSFLKKNVLPAGLFRATSKDAEAEFDIRFRVVYSRPKFVYDPLPEKETVDDDAKYIYQAKCINRMLKAFRRGGGLILSATGTGKTAIAGKFFRCIPFKCLFVVDQVDLLYQSQKEIHDWLGEEVGVVGDSEFRLERVTVATIQTLFKRLKEEDRAFIKWFHQVRCVVVDELHVQMNRSNWNVLEVIKPIARYGLTATLQLQKKEIRTKAFSFAGPVLFTFPIVEGIEQGVLTKGEVQQLMFQPVPFEVTNNYQAEYREQVVEHEVKAVAVKKIVSYLVSQGKHVVVLAERVKHVEDLSDTMTGIPHKLAYGKIEQEKRVSARRKFEKGKIQLLIANRVFKKGINLKIVDVIIDVAEMRSKNDAIQKFGRGVRLHPGKDKLLYIDFGTLQDNRFRKAAKSRANAFRKASIPIKATKVKNATHALEVIQKWLKKNSHSQRSIRNSVRATTGTQLELGLTN